MMKPVTGQYECLHRSGIGLDYFTSRIDRLTLQANGHFSLIVQERSRVTNAAKSLASGQQVSSAAPEVRREGSYIAQANTVMFHFDDGTQLQGHITTTANGSNGIQIGQDVFNKTSDSTLLPSADRLKKDMEDIAKGLKIAGAIGGVAIKAAKTIHNTIQSAQGSMPGQTSSTQAASNPASAQNMESFTPPVQQHPAQPMTSPSQSAPSIPPYQQTMPQQSPQGYVQTLYCDQCGTRARPGKHFCSNCGASLV